MRVIYGLFDPRTRELRYIGKSERGFSRLSKHLYSKELKANNHKVHWIKSLLKEGLTPEMRILKVCSKSENLGECEKAFISFHKSQGVNLVNSTCGGEGGGCIPSAETRKKLAQAKLGTKHSEETKKKMSQSHSGKSHHFYGKKLSEQHKAKIAQTLKKRLNNEV